MNFNLDLFEKTEAKEFGEVERLELGGHEVKILDAREYTGQTGNVSLKVCVDIDGTDKQKGFFKKQFDENTNMDKKWPTGATKYMSLKDEQIAYLKGFITALEKSNPSFKFNPKGTWEQLKNLKCAAVFGLEEYEKEDGSVGTATKLTQFRSLEKLADIKIPGVRTLNNGVVDYEEYQAMKKDVVKQATDLFGNDIVTTSNDMPFEI